VASLGATSVLPADADSDGDGDGGGDGGGGGTDCDGDGEGGGGSTLDAHDVTSGAQAIATTSAVVRQLFIWFEIPHLRARIPLY
jgi:hypothetical protein